MSGNIDDDLLDLVARPRSHPLVISMHFFSAPNCSSWHVKEFMRLMA